MKLKIIVKDNMDIGEIFLTNDLEAEIDFIKQVYPNNRIYFESSFKISDARAVIEESYISSNTTKCIVIAGDNFNIEAQNALLKVLEEPPNNIKFILVTKSKSAILPTILSRMIITNKKKKIERKSFDLDVNTLDLGSIVSFIKDVNYISKEESRQKIENLLFSIKKANIKLNKNELNYFNEAISQIDRGESARFVFLPLLLMLLENKRYRRNTKASCECI